MAKPPNHKFYSKSTHPKKPRHRLQKSNEQLVWGIHPVLEALKTCPHCITEIIIEKQQPGLRLESVIDLAQQHAIPVRTTETKTAGAGKSKQAQEPENSQGVSARIVLPYLTLDELLDNLKSIQGPPLLLALDSIQDPHNLGAIIRSAVAAGVNGLILPKDRSVPITGTVMKVSAGAVFHLDICKVTNLVSSFARLKEAGIWIFGTTKDSSQPIYEADMTVPACLVIGSEGKGLRPLVAEHCDLNISIPMQGELDSLNASVAAGVILFEAVRQRKSQSR